ncbi:hypothetical protein [uncultured Maricaulis sp.]|uniref:hypothetical protein n=1 Tax=uncultured Maricaulis sp. TaxID=174710 RepID=UPI0026071F56|nr:hypothetical protein [uncultured Maricaulis sp.]
MKIRPMFCAVLAAMALSATAEAQGELSYSQALRDGRYLDALDLIEAPANFPPEVASQIVAQFERSVYSMTGRHFLGYGMTEGWEPVEPGEALDPVLASLFPVDAVDAIAEAATGRQVVIINEAHNDARHRAFATRLLRRLADDGFTHFAAETFGRPEQVEEAVSLGYPTRNTGFYSMEPVFGDLVRSAMAMGLGLVRYEVTMEQRCSGECDQAAQIRARERAQATNLAAFLDANPDSRVVVFVGYQHLDETGDENGDGVLEGWMAAELTALTGIDPLTVDQQQGTIYGSGYNPPVPVGLAEHFDITRPTTFRDTNGGWFSDTFQRTVDMLVVHPFLQLGPGGRPDWMAMDGYRSPHIVAAESLPVTGPFLVQAFVADEGDGAIPMDQYLVREGETGPVTLMLPAGRYRLMLQSAGEADRELGEIEMP